MSIRYFEKEKVFMLNTDLLTYAFYINEIGATEHLYFGRRIDEVTDLPEVNSLRWRYAVIKIDAEDSEEYAAYGSMSFTEHALKAVAGHLVGEAEALVEHTEIGVGDEHTALFDVGLQALGKTGRDGKGGGQDDHLVAREIPHLILVDDIDGDIFLPEHTEIAVE